MAPQFKPGEPVTVTAPDGAVPYILSFRREVTVIQDAGDGEVLVELNSVSPELREQRVPAGYLTRGWILGGTRANDNWRPQLAEADGHPQQAARLRNRHARFKLRRTQ